VGADLGGGSKKEVSHSDLAVDRPCCHVREGSLEFPDLKASRVLASGVGIFVLLHRPGVIMIFLYSHHVRWILTRNVRRERFGAFD
jgi:hypothetical protein